MGRHRRFDVFEYSGAAVPRSHLAAAVLRLGRLGSLISISIALLMTSAHLFCAFFTATDFP